MRFSLLADELSLSSFKDKNDGLELFDVVFELTPEVELVFNALLLLFVAVTIVEAGVLTCCCG